MLISEETRPAQRTAEEIWELWATPSCWPTWDPDILAVEFDGEFVSGARGTLQPSSGPKLKWRLESVEPLVSFTTTSRLPGAKVTFIHVLEDGGAGIQVTHRIEMSGFTAPLFSRILGSKLAPSLGEAVQNLASGKVLSGQRG